jgi:CelD/BcsL family acetyltransferase involved in cellulose biosynthesis
MGNINRINKIEDLDRIAELWQSLCHRIPNCRIFETFDWCLNAWEYVLGPQGDNELYTLVWKQDGKDDMVIFPLYLDGKGCLRFIMDEHSDYCDCLYIPGQNHHLAFKDALEFIKTDKRVKQISLHKMDANSEALNYFAALAPQSQIVKENTYSWIDIAPSDDFAASQSQLRSKDKANVRAIKRKAERFNLRVYSMIKGDAYPDAEIDHIVSEMRQKGIRGDDFMTDSMKSFCQGMYESGLSDIVALNDEYGHIVAMNYILKMGSRRLSWIFLYTDSHASTELYVKYFYSDEIDSPIVFDFGSGGYEYKFGTFRPCTRALLGLTIVFDRRLALKLTFKRLLRASKDLVKQIMKRG